MSFNINLKITFTNVIKKLARKFLTFSQTVEGTDADISLFAASHSFCLSWSQVSTVVFLATCPRTVTLGESLSLTRRKPSGYWRAGGGKCRVFIGYSPLLQHHISRSGGISPHLYLPKGSPSFMAAALTTYSPSFLIIPLLPLHPICSNPAPHRGSSCLHQLSLLAVLTCLQHWVLYLH